MASDIWNTENAQDYGINLLISEHIRLRELQESDLPILTQWWNSPEFMALQGSLVLPHPGTEAAELFKGRSLNRGTTDGVGLCITLPDDTLIGHTALYNYNAPARSAELMIMIGGSNVGQGYGTMATKMIVDFGFREMGLNRIGLSVWAYNERALRTFNRAGFREEGRERQAGFHDGKFHDRIIMGLLASEYFGPRS
ncbi:GNAT family N-acetyltransferase [Glutamicibacter protophormiae]|uniref:GNAT family N-acetyltransferase n=1 Tax=Glutamicibacter protophormiae TaxID=37930 RepID=UPI00195DDFE3|nr:GNAT family protein [Glutamicibacter protophormiae]QRQ77197.1 GNAT family N-acetyltransferase [Glutamicibacter protophormiae]WPR63173.1 GNAT family protein [Glutamicibacter protophormiae]WPR66669.1 GNAT family protein [Glutamicibacter protophormiae]